VAEAARAHADEIVSAFHAGIAEGVSPATRAAVAERWLKIETTEAQLQIEEARQESEHLDRETLVRVLADKLTNNGVAAQLLRAELARREQRGVIDAGAPQPPAETSE